MTCSRFEATQQISRRPCEGVAMCCGPPYKLLHFRDVQVGLCVAADGLLIACGPGLGTDREKGPEAIRQRHEICSILALAMY
jgi:hypothetical protein